MTVYIEQVTYQGRPPGSSHPGGWSVVLGEVRTRFGKQVVEKSDPMTPEAAEELGFPMPAILASIDEQAQADLAAAHARIADLEQQLAALAAQSAAVVVTAEPDPVPAE